MKIAVLYGGYSSERDVSASSGTGVAGALRLRGHRVALVDVFLGVETLPEDMNTLFTSEDEGKRASVGADAPDMAALRALRPGKTLIGPNVIEICKSADIAFLALHGGNGENGQLQATLDMYGIPYTGSGYLGSALAMNKEISKDLFRQNGVPTPRGMILSRGEEIPTLPLPCVVKPCSGGSSVGTAIVRDKDELPVALAAAFACEERILVEEYISGRELTVGILDGKATPAVEIIPGEGFYDYVHKYQSGATVEICPAPVTEEEKLRLQELAEKAFRALRLEAYARADVLMNEQGEMFCLELNTLPGMTPTSLLPQMAQAMGMDYGELCETIIRCSMEKYR